MSIVVYMQLIVIFIYLFTRRIIYIHSFHLWQRELLSRSKLSRHCTDLPTRTFPPLLRLTLHHTLLLNPFILVFPILLKKLRIMLGIFHYKGRFVVLLILLIVITTTDNLILHLFVIPIHFCRGFTSHICWLD